MQKAFAPRPPRYGKNSRREPPKACHACSQETTTATDVEGMQCKPLQSAADLFADVCRKHRATLL